MNSVLAWMNDLNVVVVPTVVSGTATALVETGDLNLIRNDSLWSSITQYIDRIEKVNSYLAHNDEGSRPYIATISDRLILNAL